MFSPSVVNCFSCASLMRFEGYRITTRIPGTRKNPCATALPVSPEVATSTVSVRDSPRTKYPISRAVQRGRKRNQLYRKIDGLGDDLPQHFFRHVWRGKRPHHAKADFGEGQAAELFQFLRRVPRDFDGHIQAAVGRKPPQHRSPQGGQRRFSACASISHAPGSAFAVLPVRSNCRRTLSRKPAPANLLSASSGKNGSRNSETGIEQWASAS